MGLAVISLCVLLDSLPSAKTMAIGIGTRARMVARRSISIGTPSGKTNMGGISWHS